MPLHIAVSWLVGISSCIKKRLEHDVAWRKKSIVHKIEVVIAGKSGVAGMLVRSAPRLPG